MKLSRTMLFSVVIAALSMTSGILPVWASQSWTETPVWASSENERPSRKPSAYARNDRYSVEPFAPGSHNIALDVGQVFLMGNNSNYADSIGSQIHYTYGVSDMFDFDASLGYSSHSGGKYSQTTLLAGVRTNLAWYDKVIPHLVFGLGFYRPSYEFTSGNTKTSVSPVLFGVHLGPGVDLELTKQLFFGAALTFHDMFGTTELTQAGEKEVGGTYTSFFLRAGVSF